MILADKVLEERLVKDPADAVQAREWWQKGQWSKIRNRILIDPFDPGKVGAADYELSVGEEYVSLRDPYHTKSLSEGDSIELGPGETCLILTEEYIALPPNVMGFVVPRARRLFEGGSICASRIDPTWYGKLIISFTNLAKFPTSLHRGESFCIFYFAETSEVGKPLNKRDVPHLGRTRIGKLEFRIRERAFISREDVTETHIAEVLETFGRPFDIVFGAIDRSRKTTIDFIEREIAPKVAAAATDAAVRTAFRHQQTLIRILIGGLLTILAGFLAYIWIFP